MNESLRSVLPSASVLGVALVVAVVLTLSRPLISDRPAVRDGAVQMLLLTIAVQCLHMLEEFLTGFHVRLPELLGLPPMTVEFFVTFNVVWIAIWVLSAAGLRHGLRVALVPAWFLAVGMVLNLIFHPLLALRVGGYFPGLVTSPVVGVMGVALWRRLLVLTQREAGYRAARA